METETKIMKNVFMDKLGPEKIILSRDPSMQMIGMLVIDNSSYGVPTGGIRMAPDLTLKEIMRLARAMSLKFCSYKIQLGGAKAGIIADPNDKDKKVIIASFADTIKSIIKGDGYYPEPGLGTEDADTEMIFKTSGKPEIIPRRVGIIRYDIPLQKRYTGIGVYYCLETILQKLNSYLRQDDQMQWNKQPTVILEGFGRAGSSIAKRMINTDYKLLGLSTIKGGIFDENGLNIEELLSLKDEYGDDLINHYNSNDLIKVPKEKIFELSSDYSIDFIIPGARTDAINKNNWRKIDANAIVPASNACYAVDILPNLIEKRTIIFPDFISNAGDILALAARQKVNTEAKIVEYIKENIENKIVKILKDSYEHNENPYEYAENRALKEFKAKLSRKKERTEKLENLL
ncbi:MAG: hypothetical protein GF353_23280 [Candidatus Lokiarchaeota archaeon]|nr:hypothetical protein [Candidatus Lokiarchaeota archaeon]